MRTSGEAAPGPSERSRYGAIASGSSRTARRGSAGSSGTGTGRRRASGSGPGIFISTSDRLPQSSSGLEEEALRVERHVELLHRPVAAEAPVFSQEGADGLHRPRTEFRIHRVTVDVRVLDDQVAPGRDEAAVGLELLQHVLLRVVGV